MQLYRCTSLGGSTTEKIEEKKKRMKERILLLLAEHGEKEFVAAVKAAMKEFHTAEREAARRLRDMMIEKGLKLEQLLQLLEEKKERNGK